MCLFLYEAVMSSSVITLSFFLISPNNKIARVWDKAKVKAHIEKVL